MIYVTPLDPVTRHPTAPSRDSGFASIANVVALMGKPLCQGIRTVTYRNYFYSNYTFWNNVPAQ